MQNLTIMRQGRLTPWLYMGPALLILLVFVAYPAVRTVVFSFQDADSNELASENCREGRACWGILENYREALTSQRGQVALRNTALWLLVMVVGTVGFGLLLAVLTDRIRYGTLAKTIIFMPMAISFVGAAIIWRFVYDADPDTGLLNALMKLFGLEPRAWTASTPPYNTLLLTVVGVWIWTGFTMTILAAALKNIPTEILEAARTDGANEFQLFRKIMLPMLMPTIAVVVTTMTINTLKIFDIVWVMKGIETDVIATRMVSELYLFKNNGLSAAYAVILILLIVPVMVYNVNQIAAEEASR